MDVGTKTCVNKRAIKISRWTKKFDRKEYEKFIDTF